LANNNLKEIANRWEKRGKVRSLLFCLRLKNGKRKRMVNSKVGRSVLKDDDKHTHSRALQAFRPQSLLPPCLVGSCVASFSTHSSSLCAFNIILYSLTLEIHFSK